MIGAFRSWAFKQNNRSSSASSQLSQRGKGTSTSKFYPQPVLVPKHSSTLNQSNDEEMATYGNLLLCPLCQELFTHPVLLPCQHSLCYGCARAQLLSDSVDEGNLTSGESNPANLSDYLLPSNSSPPKLNYLNFCSDSLRLARSDATLSSDSGMKTDDSTDPSFVLTTKDCQRFEHMAISESSAKSSLTTLYSPLPSSSQGKSVTPGIPARPKPVKLRRSNSTSSVARPISSRSRPQQIYGTLKRSKVKSLFCPNCREMVELGKLGISGLIRNFALEVIVERFRSKAKATTVIRCGYCKPPAADATRSCLDCKLSYCNECYKTVHIWGTKKAKHSFVGPTNNFTRPKVLLCPEHSNEVSLYCNKCKKSVCRMCKVGCGAHANHSISTARVACREGKERLFVGLDRLTKKRDELVQKIDQIEEAFRQLERGETETRDVLHSSLDDMYRLLETKRSELLAKVEVRFRNNEQYLRQELQCHHQLLMTTSIVNFAQEVLKENDPIFFLQTLQMVEQKIKEVLQNLSKADDFDVIFPSTSLHLDHRHAKEELMKLDFQETASQSTIQTYPSFCQSENFQWVLQSPNQEITFENEGKTVHIPAMYWEPCELRGSMAFSSGQYSWQVSVTSYGARRILIGVSSTCPDQYRNSTSIGRGCAVMSVASGSVSMIDGGWPIADSSSADTINAFSIGKHLFTISVLIIVDHSDVTVRFYDVKTDLSMTELFQKKIPYAGPLYPTVVVHGKATIALKSEK